MNWQQWVSTLASLCGITGITGLSLRSMRKRFGYVAEVVEDELTPGNASATGRPSLRDDVGRILEFLMVHGKDIAVLQQQVADMAEEVKEHVRSPLAHFCGGCDPCTHAGVHEYVSHPLPGSRPA